MLGFMSARPLRVARGLPQGGAIIPDLFVVALGLTFLPALAQHTCTGRRRPAPPHRAELSKQLSLLAKCMCWATAIALGCRSERMICLMC